MSVSNGGDEEIKKTTQGGENDAVKQKKQTISEIAKNAFGAPSVLPVISSNHDAAEMTAADLPARQGSPAIGRLVQDYVAKNPAQAASVAHNTAELAKAFAHGDDLTAVIELLKNAAEGPAREEACLVATEEAHRSGKFQNMRIKGIDISQNALILEDDRQNKILVDACNKRLSSSSN